MQPHSIDGEFIFYTEQHKEDADGKPEPLRALAAECPTADTEGKPSFWMFSTTQQLGPHTTLIPEIQPPLSALTLPKKHQEQDLQLPGLTFNSHAGGQTRCVYGTMKSSGLKQPLQRC